MRPIRPQSSKSRLPASQIGSIPLRVALLLPFLLIAFHLTSVPVCAYSILMLDNVSGANWHPTDQPAPFFLTEFQESDLDEVDPDYEIQAVRNAFQIWEDSPHSEIAFEYMGVKPGDADQVCGPTSCFRFDGESTFYFADPRDELWDGTLAATIVRVDFETDRFFHTGMGFCSIVDTDLVLQKGEHAIGGNPPDCVEDAGNGIHWGTQEQVEDQEACLAQGPTCYWISIDSVLLMEQGHMLGLDHSDVEEAAMHGISGICDADHYALAADDEIGASFLYPYWHLAAGYGSGVRYPRVRGMFFPQEESALHFYPWRFDREGYGLTLDMKDVDGNGDFEMVFGHRSGPEATVCATHQTGIPLTDPPVRAFETPVGYDGGVEVVFGRFRPEDDEAVMVAATGIGMTNRIRFFNVDGTASTLEDIRPYRSTFSGGVHLAAGDVNGDGVDELITSVHRGAQPHCRILRFPPGATRAQVIANFLAYRKRFHGGAYLATGDLDGDGTDEIVTGAGRSGAAHIRAFKYDAGQVTVFPITNFVAFDRLYRQGVDVACWDVDQDGIDEIAVSRLGPDPSGVLPFDIRIFEPDGSPVPMHHYKFSDLDETNTDGFRIAFGK